MDRGISNYLYLEKRYISIAISSLDSILSRVDNSRIIREKKTIVKVELITIISLYYHPFLILLFSYRNPSSYSDRDLLTSGSLY